MLSRFMALLLGDGPLHPLNDFFNHSVQALKGSSRVVIPEVKKHISPRPLETTRSLEAIRVVGKIEVWDLGPVFK